MRSNDDHHGTQMPDMSASPDAERNSKPATPFANCYARSLPIVVFATGTPTSDALSLMTLRAFSRLRLLPL